MKRTVVVLSLIWIVSQCHAQTRELPYVLLISFDGFRSDYVDRFDLPNFKKFISEGAAAEALIPSFPSKTFPNHYTLVTGLYPGNHGLVDNTFYDPRRKQAYSMRDRTVVTDPAYYGGKPIWQLAHDNNVRSASYFWVGSELQQEGLHPDYFYQYNQSVPFGERVDQVIRWLRLPEADRPHLITLYFHSPDYESHRHGPVDDLTRQKVLGMDSLLGNLMHRIDSTQLPINVLLVSDHGMSELQDKEETYILIDELVHADNRIHVANGGTQAHIYTTSAQQTDSLFQVLSSRSKDFYVIRKENFPKRWHYNHFRSGELLLVANPGRYILSGTREKMREGWAKGGKFGAHGYDPDVVKEMAGIFYARGPQIKKGAKVKAFRNIHVYPLMAAILRLKAPPIDGNLKVLKGILLR